MGTYQDKINDLGPGKLIASLPLDAMISRLGIGVANAQEALDKHSMEAMVRLGETMVELPDAKDPDRVYKRSLLSLGFSPSFYQFAEANLEFKLEMHYSVTEEENITGSANLDAPLSAAAIGATVSATSGRKFGMDASMMTSVSLRMLSVPPPQAFMEMVRAANPD